MSIFLRNRGYVVLLICVVEGMGEYIAAVVTDTAVDGVRHIPKTGRRT